MKKLESNFSSRPTRAHRYVLWLVSALFFLGFPGCSLFTRPSPPSLAGFREASPQERAEFLRQHKERDDDLRAGRGRYDVEIRKGIHREQATQVVVFERPAKLRLEIFATSLNQLMLMLVAKEDFVEALDPKEGVLYRALPTPKSIFKLLGVPLVPEELELWLSGMLLMPDDESRVKILKDPKDDIIGLEADAAFGRVLRARFASRGQELRLLSLEFGKSNSDESYFFSELSYAEKELIPNEIEFHLPDQGVDGTLIRKSFNKNPEFLPPKLFQIPDTGNYTVEGIE